VALAPEQWNATGNPELFQLTQPVKLVLYAETGGQTAIPNRQPSPVQFDNGLPSICEAFAPDERGQFVLDQLPPGGAQLNGDALGQAAATGKHLEQIGWGWGMTFHALSLTIKA
jgi:hypothetical protein